MDYPINLSRVVKFIFNQTNGHWWMWLEYLTKIVNLTMLGQIGAPEKDTSERTVFRLSNPHETSLKLAGIP